MKITAINVSYGVTLSDGNFGSVRAEMFIAADLVGEDVLEDATRELFLTARHGVYKELSDSAAGKVRREAQARVQWEEDHPF